MIRHSNNTKYCSAPRGASNGIAFVVMRPSLRVAKELTNQMPLFGSRGQPEVINDVER